MTEKIYSDLAKVMRSVDHVGKGDFNSHQKFKFRGIDGVLNAVGPALREHNVVVFPHLVSADYEHVQTSGGKASTACRVVVDYIFAADDGSQVESRVAAESWDTGDKAMPKAMSVAFRTALIQTLSLPTDEPDPDSFTYAREASDERRRLVAEKIEAAGTVDELRALWSQADQAQQSRITERVEALKGDS